MSNKPKIYVVSEYISSSENTTGFYWDDIISSLSKKYIIVVVTTSQFDISEPTYEVKYIRVSASVFSKAGYLFKLFNQIFISLKLLMAIVFRLRKGDLVLCGTNPSFFLILLSFFKRFIKFKWLLCVHDVFPRNLVPLGLVSENSVFFKLLSFVFQRSYMSVDKLVVIGRDMKDFFIKSGLCEDYIHVIENWYDPNVLAISEQRDLSIFKGVDWDKKIVYQFFGNIGAVQGVRNLVSGLSLVKRKDLLFVFSGDGSESDFLRQHVRCSGSTNIFYYGSVPQEEKMSMLAACDVAIVSLVDGMKGLAVPSKAYFSLAANKPLFVIGDKGSELELMMADHAVGWFCDSSNPQVIANLLESIESSDVLERAGRARKLAIKNYSPQRALKQYDVLVSGLL
jgi:hypothetical protein